MSTGQKSTKKIAAPRSALPKLLKRGILPIGSIAGKVVLGTTKENRIPDRERKNSTSCPPARKRLRMETANSTSAVKTPKQQTASSKPQPSTEAEKRPKRAAWDIKGRLQDSEAALQTLRQKFSTSRETIAELEKGEKTLTDELNSKTNELMIAFGKVASLEKSLSEKEKECEDILESKIQFEVMAGEQIAKLQHELLEKDNVFDSLNRELSVTNEDLRGKSEFILHLQSVMRRNETLRRQLHNTIQELKGNIRVYCRVRPFLPDETLINTSQANILYPEENVLQLQKICDSNLNENTKTVQKYDFKFDRVFDGEAKQTDVFEEVTHLVQSSVDGFNVCLFAYGQTGSGKTYTMEGPSDLILDESINDAFGIIPRALNEIFVKVEELKEKGWQYSIEVTAIEIYNESIRDLLGSSNSKARSHQSDNPIVEKVTSGHQVYSLLKKARKNRAVAATLCNQHSSRSHSVFTIKIGGENGFTQERCEGLLNLVDLAGSERLKESGSEGDRLTETKNINSSLSNLKGVIMALAQKKEHIPYRDSKLTFLLRNSLGGNSKTLMLVNVSPGLDHFGETLNSLRFATQVNQCHIGTATKILK